MMEIKLICAMCGREKEITVNETATGWSELGVLINEQAKWIWQQNAHNLDVYCSKKCAA